MAFGEALAANFLLLTGPVHATMIIFCDTLQGDLDNRLKRTIDAMSGVVFEDDAQIETIHAHRYDASRPRDLERPSPRLVQAMDAEGDCVYLRIEERA